MKKALLILALSALLKPLYSDCLLYSIEYDTIQDMVIVKVCNTLSIENCRIDTSTEKKLLDTLRYQFNKYNTMIIASVDTIISVNSSGSGGWGIDSVVFKIDSILKGSVGFNKIGYIHNKFEDTGNFNSIKNQPFLSFFDDDSIPDLLGLLDPSPCYNGFGGLGQGYFIVDGKIENRGIDAILGVSTTIDKIIIGTASIRESSKHNSIQRNSTILRTRTNLKGQIERSTTKQKLGLKKKL